MTDPVGVDPAGVDGANPRDLDQLRARAAAVGKIYVDRFGIEADAHFYLGKLSEELGELTAAHLKLTGRARRGDRPQADLIQDLADETADLFGFLLLFADWQGIDLADAFDRKWGQYLDRDRPADPGTD